MKNILILIAWLAFFSWTHGYGQDEINCRNSDCTYDPSLSVSALNFSEFTRFEIPLLNDSLRIFTSPGDRPRDFRTYVQTRSSNGEDIEIEVNSQRPSSKASSFILIADSVKNLSVNNNGFSGNNYPNSSAVCATRIKNGDYGSAIRTAFLNRRVAQPTLSSNNCDATDLLSVRNLSPVTCESGSSEIPTTQISGVRWKPKRECSTKAGRAMCAAKRVALNCDSYADKRPSPNNGCCNVSASPSGTGWLCNTARCNSTDSGWYRRYTFRMWEEDYESEVVSGKSNQFLCETMIATQTGATGDTYSLRDRNYSTNLTYYNTPGDFTFNPPAGEPVVETYFAAGKCGSYNDVANPDLTDYSEYFTPNGSYLRMQGNGHKVKCVGSYTDYSPTDYCYNALMASSNSNSCTGTYQGYSPGNQCWEELLPSCSGSYDDYPNGSYCYNKLVNNCAGSYADYPTGTYCYERLKRESCSGDYTDFPAGSVCWNSNQPSCPGVYNDHATGSYCWQKLAPYCPQAGQESFCNNYLDSYPANFVCLGSYTDYPQGSKCWSELQPTCVGTYTDYPVNSYCYNKLAPTCTGSYTDYAANSYCYQQLIPATCSGVFTDYPEGSFCYNNLIPTCPGIYSDYPYGSYCYNKLSANACPGVYTDYAAGSFCRRQLAPSCEGTYTSYPEGSFCWSSLQPTCSGLYTNYAVGTYCYNKLNPSQPNPNKTPTPDVCAPADTAKIGSLCWSESYPACNPETTYAYDSYCWHKLRASSFCGGGYEEYPKGSFCWNAKRVLPALHYYSDNSCAVKCDFNGSFMACDIGAPDTQTPHVETTANFVGTRVNKDAWVSFKVRIKTLNVLGFEKNTDTEVRIRVRNTDY